MKTLESKNHLASLLNRQGDKAAAESLLQEILETRLRVLGPQHPATLQNMDEVAGILWLQDKRDAALEMQRRVLAARKAAQGLSHPQTLASMDTVVGSAWGQGRLEEATAQLREALQVRQQQEQQTEKEADVVLTMTARLAYLLWTQKELDEALALYQRALEAYRRNAALGLPDQDERIKECENCLVDILAEKTAGQTIV